MAQTYRCPVCGATHKDLPEACRLCGQMMGPDATVGEPHVSTMSVEDKKGLAGIVGVMVLLVVAVVVAAVLLGVVPGTKSIDSVRSKVGLSSTPDGWSRFDYPEGGFSVELPDGNRKTQTTDGTYQASMLIGKDTAMIVSARQVMTADQFAQLVHTSEASSPLKRELTNQGDSYEAKLKSESGKVDKRSETAAYGVPAIYYETRDIGVDKSLGLRSDATFYGREMLFLANGVLYTVEVVSVYKNPEQFDRVLGSLQISGPPGKATGTTAAP